MSLFVEVARYSILILLSESFHKSFHATAVSLKRLKLEVFEERLAKDRDRPTGPTERPERPHLSHLQLNDCSEDFQGLIHVHLKKQTLVFYKLL